MTRAGVYVLEWDATITNSAQRAAPTIDVQDDSDDAVIGSAAFSYLRYAKVRQAFAFSGLLVVAADDTVCKAIVYNKTEDEGFTVAAGHKLRIVSLGGSGPGLRRNSRARARSAMSKSSRARRPRPSTGSAQAG